MLEGFGVVGALGGDAFQHRGDALGLQLRRIGGPPLGHALGIGLVGQGRGADLDIDQHRGQRTQDGGQHGDAAAALVVDVPDLDRLGGRQQAAGGLGPGGVALGGVQQAAFGQAVDLGELLLVRLDVRRNAVGDAGSRRVAQDQSPGRSRQPRRRDPECDHGRVLAGNASGC
jgi:hypothetical protein